MNLYSYEPKKCFLHETTKMRWQLIWVWVLSLVPTSAYKSGNQRLYCLWLSLSVPSHQQEGMVRYGTVGSKRTHQRFGSGLLSLCYTLGGACGYSLAPKTSPLVPSTGKLASSAATEMFFTEEFWELCGPSLVGRRLCAVSISKKENRLYLSPASKWVCDLKS